MATIMVLVTPMMMPSTVSTLRILFVHSCSNALLMFWKNSIIHLEQYLELCGQSQ